MGLTSEYRIVDPVSGLGFAHTTVLGLPCEKVQECCKWLTNETKANPKDTISNDLTIGALHLFEGQSCSN